MTDGPLARLKAYILIVYSWLREELAAARDEIAPQLRGVSLPSIPDSAVKPLLLAGILIISAVAIPAAPFAGESGVETQDPVEGETYDAAEQGTTFNGASLNQLPGSLTDGTAEAPDPPENVRASAGSQTMSVQTSVVDGDPAIVLEDDRTHEGRWVAVDASWFQEELGEVPQTARIEHETDGTYSTPIEVRGEQAAFYVEGFSTNTVTFDGVLSVSASPAVDGDTISYDAPNGGDDLSIDLTGVKNTAGASVSGSISGSGTLSADVGGTTAPTSESLTFVGERSESNGDQSWTSVSPGDSLSLSNPGNTDPVGPDGSGNPILSVSNPEVSYTEFGGRTSSKTIWGASGGGAQYRTEMEFDNPPSEIGAITIGIDSGATDPSTGTIKVYANGNGVDQSYGDGTLVAEKQVSTSPSGSEVRFEFDQLYQTGGAATTIEFVSSGFATGSTTDAKAGGASEPKYSYDFGSSYALDVAIDATVSNGDADLTVSSGSSSTDITVAEGTTKTNTIDLSSADSTLSISGVSAVPVDVNLKKQDVTETQNPEATVNGQTVAHSGTLSDGQTVTKTVDLSQGSNSIDVSTLGSVGVESSWTETTETTDPVVEYNGNSVGYTGTLADGETTSLPVNDSWINEGTNDLTVSLGSVSSGPVPQVGVDVTHDVSESRTIDYSAEAFSERYTTSKTWSENTSNATMRIPWASSSVVSVRDVSVTYEDSTGSEPSPRPTPTHRLENGTLVVELGDVEAGWSTEISATGSKVQVDGADLEVVNATAAGEDLNTRVRLNNPSENVFVQVGETEQGQQLHYLANASWSNEEASQISADGTNEIRIPNAPDNGEAQLRTLPLAFDVGTGAIDVDVPSDRVNTNEPVYRVSPGDSTGDTYDVTYVDAADGQPYVLYDETDEIVLDQGLASSPLTLSATEPEESHVIQFREDDGSASGDGSGPVGAIGPMVTTSSPFSGFTGLLPGPNVFLIGLAGLAGLGIVARQTRLFDEGTTSDAIADSAASVGERGGELLGRALSNQLVLAALTLGGGVWLLTSGAFTPTERLIISIGTVPVAMFLVLQQFDQFDIRVWAGSTAVIAVLGIQAIAPEVFTTIAEEAGIVIVAGALILGWRALSAWRAEASTPDSVTNLEIETEDDDGN